MDKNVMIVDDDPAIRDTVEIVLEDEGFNLTTAASGPEGLEHLRSGFQGLILMDIMMPEMDGWDTLKSMQEEGLLDGNVVCMLTAVDQPGEKSDGLQECVLDYMTKPFDSSRLVAMINDYLHYLEQ